MAIAMTPTERQEQRALVAWLRMKPWPFFAVPNGAVAFKSHGKKGFALLASLRAEGLVEGAPDLVIAHRVGPVALEMKRTAKSRLSDSQLSMHDRLRRAGWVVIVAHGADDAVRQIGRLTSVPQGEK